MSEKINAWLSQALHDLDGAKINFASQLFDISLYLCEQAVEKLLKAHYIKKFSKEPPKTHNLDVLLEALDLAEDLKDFSSMIDQYYFTIRYPSQDNVAPFTMVNAEDAQRGLDAAGAIFKKLQGGLQ